MSTDDNTIEEFSKKVGNKTVEQENSTVNSLGMNTHINDLLYCVQAFWDGHV